MFYWLRVIMDNNLRNITILIVDITHLTIKYSVTKWITMELKYTFGCVRNYIISAFINRIEITYVYHIVDKKNNN